VGYYYLGAQLPYLIYGQTPPMTSKAFKELASELMGSSGAALLEYCTLDPAPPKEENKGAAYAEPAPATSSSLINKWKEWERTLRLNLAKNRSLKLKREASTLGDAPAVPADAALAAKNAMAMESPLEAELHLCRAQWDAIESFQGLSSFSESSMYAYMLKLLIMERMSAFKTEEGHNEYKALYAAILGERKLEFDSWQK